MPGILGPHDVEDYSQQVINAEPRRPQIIVLHYTELDWQASMECFIKGEVSCHFMISREGKVAKIVDPSMRAYHAGQSQWRGFKDINSLSVGIELEHPGFVHHQRGPEGGIIVPGHCHAWIPYAPCQINKLGKMLQDIQQAWNIASINIVGHSDIAPGRKIDPGPLFPWRHLYEEYGVGVWYDIDKPLMSVALPEETGQNLILWTQMHLRQYGYASPLTGTLDQQTRRVIQAFQMHFRPECIDGENDAETRATLAAVIDQNLMMP